MKRIQCQDHFQTRVIQFAGKPAWSFAGENSAYGTSARVFAPGSRPVVRAFEQRVNPAIAGQTQVCCNIDRSAPRTEKQTGTQHCARVLEMRVARYEAVFLYRPASSETGARSVTENRSVRAYQDAALDRVRS